MIGGEWEFSIAAICDLLLYGSHLKRAASTLEPQHWRG